MLFLETIRTEGGAPLHLSYHQQRLDRTLDAFGIAARYDLSELLSPPPEGIYRCRVVYGDEQCSVDYLPYTPRSFRTLQAVCDDEIEYPFKYANRTMLDLLYEEREEADDIVIVKEGLITDSTIANIALFDGSRWLTPARPLLEGTTRRRLLDEGKIFEADIPLKALASFGRCALMNAMVGFCEVENGILPPK